MSNSNGTAAATDSGSKIDKLKRYGWTSRGERPVLSWIPKASIQIDGRYQRKPSDSKVLRIASEFSWVAFGAISVARRPDGTFFVFDGQHRLLAVMRRSDIESIPCVVFDISPKEEAGGFLDANSERRPVNAAEKFAAGVYGDRADWTIVSRVLQELGMSIEANPKVAAGPNSIRCIALVFEIARSSGEQVLRDVLVAAREVSADRSPSKPIISAIHWMTTRLEEGLSPRLVRRLAAIGPVELEKKGREYATMCGSGGAAAWAKGMIEIANRGLQKKFEINTKKK